MNPYRKKVEKEQILVKKRPFWRTKYREFLILFYGTYKARKPEKCPQCGKRSYPSTGQVRSYVLNHFDCGHQRYPGIWISAS